MSDSDNLQSIDFYRLESLSSASINEENWQPALGYKRNRQTIQKIYEYYKALFNNEMFQINFYGQV